MMSLVAVYQQDVHEKGTYRVKLLWTRLPFTKFATQCHTPSVAC